VSYIPFFFFFVYSILFNIIVHISTDNTFCFIFAIYLVFNSGWGYEVSAGAEIPGIKLGFEVIVGVDAEFDKKVDK
jgi:hypothetical protein